MYTGSENQVKQNQVVSPLRAGSGRDTIAGPENLSCSRRRTESTRTKHRLQDNQNPVKFPFHFSHLLEATLSLPKHPLTMRNGVHDSVRSTTTVKSNGKGPQGTEESLAQEKRKLCSLSTPPPNVDSPLNSRP